MQRYKYWQPGNKTGAIQSATTYDAACKVLGGRPLYCGGDPKQDGARYVSAQGQGECKIWSDRGGAS